MGRNVLRKEGAAKVTGAARYVDDLSFQGLLVDDRGPLGARRAEDRPAREARDDHVEDMLATTTRHPAIVRHRTGVTCDGRLTATDIDASFDGGRRGIGLSPSSHGSGFTGAGVAGTRPRVALGSVAPTVVRLPRTEAALAAREPIEAASATLSAG